MTSGLAVMDNTATRGKPVFAIGRHPGSDVLAEINGLPVRLPPSTASSILLDQALRLDDRKMQHTLSRDVVLVPRNVLTLLIGMDASRKAVDLPKAVVARATCTGESPAAREL